LNKIDEERLKKLIQDNTFSITPNSDSQLADLVAQKSRQRVVNQMSRCLASYKQFGVDRKYLENMVILTLLSFSMPFESLYDLKMPKLHYMSGPYKIGYNLNNFACKIRVKILLGVNPI
jgi:hypothetical protein